MSSPLHQPSHAPKTLSIGGATFDLFLTADAALMHECDNGKSFSLPLGKKISVNDVVGTYGGGAHNTAIGLARLGCDAGFSGVIGDDQWGEAIATNMETEQVRTEYLTVIEHEPSSFSVILTAPGGERTILTHKGMDRHFHDVTFDRDAAMAVDAVYLNHIHEDTCVIEDDIVQILADLPNMHLSWNPGGCQIDAGLTAKNNLLLLAHTDLLLLNKEEAFTFTQTKSERDAMRTLMDAGVKVVCITDGPNGAMACDGTTLYHCPALPCDVVDMTGAGDAFGTGVTWGLITGKDLPTALKAGTINAMSVVGVIGAQAGLLTQTKIQTELEQTNLEVTMKPF